MKKIYALLLFCGLWNFSQAQQVTQIYTDYNNFWTSSSTSINSLRPNVSHNLLAFKIGNTVYSTGVNNAKLTANGITYSDTKFRALPILTLPLTDGGTATQYYFNGIGSAIDGSAVNYLPANITAVTTAAQKAAFLTDGEQGLNLGTCLANIPTTTVTFNLSDAGITQTNIGGSPDILVSQTALPSQNSTAKDQLWFVDVNGATVGNIVNVDFTNTVVAPTVGNWNADFYRNDKSQLAPVANYTNTEKQLRFVALDLTDFGINSTNYSTARKLLYKPTGESDPAFLAFNEPSIGVAAKLAIATAPTTTNCNGYMPSNFTVRLTDAFGYNVKQENYPITASMSSGPGQLLGTVTRLTNADGIATFDDLHFEVGGDHKIKFENTSLQFAETATINGATGCDDVIWVGTTSNWNTPTNWIKANGTAITEIPNANNNVTIPTVGSGKVYPTLTTNAGAKNLTLGPNARITLNGKLFTIKGTITKDATAYVIGSATGSELYMSGTSLQTIPSGFLQDGKLDNFSVENAGGVALAGPLNTTGIVRVYSGELNTNGNLTLVCTFFDATAGTTRKTSQIGRLDGTITGNVTAEQCFPARRAFRLVASSVTTTTSIRANWQENASAYNNNPVAEYGTHITGTTVDGTNGFDWQPSGAASMFTFNSATQTWGGINNTNTNTLTAGRPYRLLIRGNRSTNITSNSATPTRTKLRSKGTVVKGPVTVNTASGLPLSNVAGGYTLLGNPFHSAVDMGAVMANATNLSPFYTIWDPTLGGTPVVGVLGGRGAFVTISTTTGAATVQGGASGTTAANRYLQPYQAFFVQSTAPGASITFRESDKATGVPQTNVFKTSAQPYISLGLYTQAAIAESNTASDGVRIDFQEGADSGNDMYDAPKFANLDENLSRLNGENLVALESRALAQVDEELPLSITQYRQADYAFKAELGSFDGLDVYIKDNFLNQETLLSQDEPTTVNFTVDATDAASASATRFSIVFRQAVMGTNPAIANNSFSLYPNPVNGNELYINAGASYQTADVAIYNTLGQMVYSATKELSANNQVALHNLNLQEGVYILKLKTNTGATYNTKFVKK